VDPEARAFCTPKIRICEREPVCVHLNNGQVESNADAEASASAASASRARASAAAASGRSRASVLLGARRRRLQLPPQLLWQHGVSGR